MIAVPFIYFSIIAYLQYRKNKRQIDIGFLMASIYAVSGFFSILSEYYGITYVSPNYQVTLLPTILYCFLLTINLYPFLKYTHLKITSIKPVRNPKYITILAWVSIIWFILLVLFTSNHILNVFSGDMRELRMSKSAGDYEDYMSSVPTMIRPLMIMLNMVFGCPWILILMAFFSRYIQQLPIKYFAFLFISSLSGPLVGIAGVDRSATAYWIISLIIIFIFFKPLIPIKEKKYLYWFFSSILGLLVIYLSLMTISRFESDTRLVNSNLPGELESMIGYLGQSYQNFCYFFDEFKPAFTNLNLIFPFTSYWILGDNMVGAVKLQSEMTLKTGIFTGVFYTYLGQIMIFCGKWVMFLYCFIYTLIAQSKLRIITQGKFVNIQTIFVYIGLSSIMFLGIFTYHYASPTRTFSVMFILLFISNLVRRRI